MALRIPDAMDECIYFTRRATPDIGKVIAWVERQHCGKCRKGWMTKPKDAKTGGYKIRSEEYVCSNCGNSMEKAAYEATLTCSITYTCPKCSRSGEAQVPFKRKSWQGVPAIVYECQHCGEKLGITKKMKEGKKKVAEEVDDDDF